MDRFIKIRCDKCNKKYLLDTENKNHKTYSCCRDIIYRDDSYNDAEIPDYLKNLSNSICNHMDKILDKQDELIKPINKKDIKINIKSDLNLKEPGALDLVFDVVKEHLKESFLKTDINEIKKISTILELELED